MSESGSDGGSSSQSVVSTLIANDASVGRWMLDPEKSRIEFHVKHFWGAITVHGSFSKLSGEGSISSSRAIIGQLIVDAASLATNNKKRDAHLRSADFFDVDNHPHVVVTVRMASQSIQPRWPARGRSKRLDMSGRSHLRQMCRRSLPRLSPCTLNWQSIAPSLT